MFNKLGYIDFDFVMQDKKAFTFIIGARGTGKTFGAILWCIRNNKKFILLRKTQAQTDLINNPVFSPIKKIAAYLGVDYRMKQTTKYNSEIYIGEKVVGVTAALSTFSNLRGGYDASDIDVVIFDEFIGETGERRIKDEASMLWNMQETTNRNRELEGREPLYVLCLANAMNIANSYFIELGIVSKIYKMQRNKSNLDYNTYKTNDLAVYVINRSPISEQKRNTALYRMLGDRESSFVDMALDNKFDVSNYDNISSQSLAPYRVVVNLGELGIYKHKAESRYYVTTHKSGTAKRSYKPTKTDIGRFKSNEKIIGAAYLAGRIWYEDIVSAVLFDSYLNM